MVKITGYYQLPGRLPQAVDFSELFDRSFMRRFTHCRSFERFLAGGRFRVRSQAEFEALPRDAVRLVEGDARHGDGSLRAAAAAAGVRGRAAAWAARKMPCRRIAPR